MDLYKIDTFEKKTHLNCFFKSTQQLLLINHIIQPQHKLEWNRENTLTKTHDWRSFPLMIHPEETANFQQNHKLVGGWTIIWGSNRPLRMLMEPKEYGEEMIEHPNHDLRIRTIHFHMSSKYLLRLGLLFCASFLGQNTSKPKVFGSLGFEHYWSNWRSG